MPTLRIVDKPSADGRDEIEISLDGSESSLVDFTGTADGGDLQQTLRWYFAEYPHDPSSADDRGAASMIVEIGRALGGALLADAKAETLERSAQDLAVLIESGRLEFFQRPWELLAVPSSGNVLSAISKDFVRRFPRDGGFSEDDADVVYDLGVTVPVPQAVAALQQQLGGARQGSEDTRQAPLRILHVVSRAHREALPFASTDALALTMEPFGFGIDLEIFAHASWDALCKRLADRARPVHIVHYDGPVLLDGATPRVVLDPSGEEPVPVAVTDFASALVENRVAVLAFDARGYLEGRLPVAAAPALAAVARAARAARLKNIIGLSHVTDPWTSGRCFRLVYGQLTAGLTLGRAVVEARRALQESAETSRFTSHPVPFQSWPLLVHYGGQHVKFFDAAQPRLPPEESPSLARARDRLWGFKATLLPPLVEDAGDRQAVAVLGVLGQGRRAVVVTGRAGTGKTHLAHRVALYLAQRDIIDFAFCFDYVADFYSADSMLEMMAPVLGLEPNRRVEARAALRKRRCCFVLDDLPEISDEDPRAARSAALLDLVREWIADGHIVLITGSRRLATLPSELVEVELEALSTIEQRVLTAPLLRANELAGRDRDEDWPKLLATTAGHPFLLKHVVPLLAGLTTRDLVEEIGRRTIGRPSLVDSFYEWQWADMPRQWQHLLLLASEVEGLFIEMLMVVVDRNEPFEPAKRLLAAFGDEKAAFSDGFSCWQRSGFLTRLAHGHVVEPRCLPFLEDKRKQRSPSSGVEDDLRLAFSQTLCEGLRMLSTHLQRGQGDPALTRYLLVNRRHWVPHLERLWFREEHRAFLSTKHAFDLLLRQAQLGGESAAWSLDVLARSPAPRVGHGELPDAALAWLALAIDALAARGASEARALVDGAAAWERWARALAPDSLDNRGAASLQRVAAFLDPLYRARRDWRAAIAINEKALSVAERFGAWPSVIQALKALALCHTELGEPEKTSSYEQKIVDEIPYTDAPPGFQAQQLFEVAMARASRGAYAEARAVVARLSAMGDADRFGDMLEGLKADLDYQEGRFVESIRHYCVIWKRAVQQGQRRHLDALQKRFHEIEQKLGSDECYRHIDANLPRDVVRPRELH
ncbi:NACHT domain-containing protein [Sorangium sp. So ce1153]|uniref:NACHT domain-containing protein n=1 Tax=Sorangium sp. So ce1153 TaxID=3133333 RepID=UPI003F5DE8CA